MIDDLLIANQKRLIIDYLVALCTDYRLPIHFKYLHLCFGEPFRYLNVVALHSHQYLRLLQISRIIKLAVPFPYSKFFILVQKKKISFAVKQ